MNNLSKEVLKFYIDVYCMLKDPEILSNLKSLGLAPEAGASLMKEKTTEVHSRINITEDHQIDVVVLWRVHQVLKVYFVPMLPETIMTSFRKNVETYLRVQTDDGQSKTMNWIDQDRFMDQSILLYLRFNKLHEDPLNKLFFAWTLFSVDEIEFDQLYMMLKILMPKAK